MANATSSKDPDSTSEEVVDRVEENNEEKMTKMPQKVSQEIVFNKDIIIHANEPLPQFDKGKIKAYRATGKNKTATNLIAFACDKSLTPRRTTSIKYGKITHQSLVNLVGAGKVFWPKTESEKFFFIFEDTLGKPIVKKVSESVALGWKPEDVMVNVAYPMIHVLTNMRNMDVVHGQIWPGNMFYNGSPGADKVTLGECLSAPTSYHLPALYEPVERAIASPIARGTGTTADDLYSFGVSLAVILRTSDPMKGANDEEIIEHKIEKGSYATLLGKDRLSGAMLELLRGLLYDDPEQRWTLEDLESWIDGRRLSPKQSPKRVKASRPFVLNDDKYIRPELLAKDMTSHVDEMVRLIEGGDLHLWIERAIEDKTVKVRVEQMLEEVKKYDRTDGHNARVCSVVASALCPEGPIHYHSLKFHPLGFGKSLTEAYVLNKDLQDYTDIMRSMFVLSCIRVQRNSLNSGLVTKLDSCRTFINQTTLNSGLERCIYFLNPDCSCLSSILEKYYVQTPEEVLLALEDICAKGNPKVIFDRHVVSFLSVKDRRNIDPYLSDLMSDEPYRRVLGRIRTLATIQKRSGIDKCPALVEWVSNNLESVYDRFHDAKKRDEIQKKVEKVKKINDLTKVALLFDDPKLFQTDVSRFYGAMQEYQRLEDEKKRIIDRIENKKSYGQRSGQQVASIVSLVISFVIMVIAAYVMVVKG